VVSENDELACVKWMKLLSVQCNAVSPSLPVNAYKHTCLTSHFTHSYV